VITRKEINPYYRGFLYPAGNAEERIKKSIVPIDSDFFKKEKTEDRKSFPAVFYLCKLIFSLQQFNIAGATI